ncbi:MAG: DUF3352 domain-containing protein, partial [Myxococcota bacterium]
PPADIVNAQAELRRSLGFDPLTEEGLAEAGLPPRGRVVGTPHRNGALWVFPVADAGKARATVERLVQARSTADKTSSSVKGVKVDIYGRSFGDEMAEVAGFAVTKGLGFLTLGTDARAQIEAALGRTRETSILSAPGFAALQGRVAQTELLRVVMPRGAEALRQAAESMRRTGVRVDARAVEEIAAAAWSLDVADEGVRAHGFVQLEEPSLSASKKIFSTKVGLSDGIRSVDLPASVLFATMNGEPEALLTQFAPPGSPARRRVSQVIASLGMTDEADVLARLTGQVGLAMGLGDLADVSFRTLMGNPLSAAWTAIALGVKSPESFAEVDASMTAKLAERGFEPKTTEIEGQTVTRVHAVGSPETVLVDSFARPGAVVYANEPAVTQGILGIAPGLDPLQGKPGISVDLRIGRLSQQLRSFRVESLPLRFQSMVRRGITGLGLFDSLEARVRPTDDGLTLDARLSLALPADE